MVVVPGSDLVFAIDEAECGRQGDGRCQGAVRLPAALDGLAGHHLEPWKLWDQRKLGVAPWRPPQDIQYVVHWEQHNRRQISLE